MNQRPSILRTPVDLVKLCAVQWSAAELHVGLEGGVDADDGTSAVAGVFSARFMPAPVTTTGPRRTSGMTLVAAAVPASAGAVKETVEACGGPTILSLVGLKDDRDRGVADGDDRSGEGSMSDLAWRSERRARGDAPVAAASGQSCGGGGNPATRERRRDAEQVRRGEAPPSSSSVTSSAVPRAPACGVRRSGEVHLDKGDERVLTEKAAGTKSGHAVPT